MTRVIEVEIEGLFGAARHLVRFRDPAPTIITAPNGTGKTHILKLLSAGLALDVKTLLSTSYRRLRVTFSDGQSLAFDRVSDTNTEPRLIVSALRGTTPNGRPLTVRMADLDEGAMRTPPHIRKLDHDRFWDSRLGRTFSRAAIQRRFRLSGSDVPARLTDRSPEVMALCEGPAPMFIDTKRLDTGGFDSTEGDSAGPRFREAGGAATRIHEYMEQLRGEVTEARRSSIQATQSADLSFAARALAAAKLTVQEAALHKRYDRTVERYETLARNALAVGEAPIEFPAETTPTVRRILSVFLDDWDKRLEPLLPLNDKIQTLREIVDAKLAPSGKRTAMSPHGSLEFRSARGGRIRVADLSSGEQHMVALFTLLLFSAKRGSLVLIDEPEISFHAAWKHAFLDDISRISELSDLQVVMATHSAAIVNGRWDLTEELVFETSADDDNRTAAVEVADELDEFDE